MTECSHILCDLTRKVVYVLKVPYNIKNHFQKFVISYDSEFGGQSDFKIGDGKSCQKTPKIAKRFNVLGLSDLFSKKNHKLH